ncbi:MAG: AlkA N-terminal domain-containing protein [Azonexus sp.]|nr:AlkA N-terminal domain-containing protein [Azonexus sp.]
MSVFRCSLELPAGFRAADILKFHHRDPQAVAERVTADRLEKALVWQGQVACLCVHFQAQQAEVEIALDGTSTAASTEMLASHVGRMLGLTQPVEAFEALHRQHPQLGWLIARQSGLRVPLAATPFEALTWAITGQQISVSAAVSMRRKLIKAAGLVHSSGLACYPDASSLAALSEADLRAAGFSQSKTQTLLAVSAQVLAGQLPLDEWLETLPVDEIRSRLLAIRGIGPWTVNYALLRGFGWLDGSLHGDAAVRRALQGLFARSEKVGEAEAQARLDQFSPWRALVGAHLWASLSLAA